MKKMKALGSLAACLILAVSFGGCQMVDSITGDAAQSQKSGSSQVTPEDLKTVDKSIAVPVFDAELTSYAPMVLGSEYYLDGTAVSPDGGEITYQWYVNNVNSNGGGTKIDGETGPLFRVDTSETGTKFYYVVASNNHENSYNMTTSNPARIEVLKHGEWTVDEFGGVRYLAEDGTYPADRWVLIDGFRYRFDANGYRLTGWHYEGGNYIYFDGEGRLLCNAETPEGYHTNEKGVLIEDADPLGYRQQEAEAQAAAAAAADQAAAAAAEQEAAAPAEQQSGE